MSSPRGLIFQQQPTLGQQIGQFTGPLADVLQGRNQQKQQSQQQQQLQQQLLGRQQANIELLRSIRPDLFAGENDGEALAQADPNLIQEIVKQGPLQVDPKVDPVKRAETLKRLGLPEDFDDLSKAEQSFVISEAQETKRKGEKDVEASEVSAGALDVVDRMRQIRSNGNLGIASRAKMGSPDVRRDRSEYETLGKSLISFATSIPIRNRLEFETLAGNLFNPDITDAAAEGLLDAMTRIINKGDDSSSQPSGQAQKPRQFSSDEVDQFLN